MQLDYTFERQLELEREAASSQAWQQGLEQGLTTGMERGRIQKVILRFGHIIEQKLHFIFLRAA